MDNSKINFDSAISGTGQSVRHGFRFIAVSAVMVAAVAGAAVYFTVFANDESGHKNTNGQQDSDSNLTRQEQYAQPLPEGEGLIHYHRSTAEPIERDMGHIEIPPPEERLITLEDLDYIPEVRQLIEYGDEKVGHWYSSNRSLEDLRDKDQALTVTDLQMAKVIVKRYNDAKRDFSMMGWSDGAGNLEEGQVGKDVRNGQAVEIRWFCSDVCPAAGFWGLYYQDVGEQECPEIGGQVRTDAAGGGYIGCEVVTPEPQRVELEPVQPVKKIYRIDRQNLLNLQKQVYENRQFTAQIHEAEIHRLHVGTYDAMEKPVFIKRFVCNYDYDGRHFSKTTNWLHVKDREAVCDNGAYFVELLHDVFYKQPITYPHNNVTTPKSFISGLESRVEYCAGLTGARVVNHPQWGLLGCGFEF
jgi:hypothetical protein